MRFDPARAHGITGEVREIFARTQNISRTGPIVVSGSGSWVLSLELEFPVSSLVLLVSGKVVCMISVIIPTYNERGNIRLLYGRIARSMEKQEDDFEVIIVDDNSPDGTGREVKELGKKDKRIKLVERKGKLGLSSAVMAGVERSEGEKIIVMDADLSHPPEKLPEIAAALENCDVVVGSRNIAGGGVRKWPVHRRAISLGATILAKSVLGAKTSDPMSGFFGVKREIIRGMKIRSKGYKILMSILAGSSKLEIREVPYFFEDRRAGKTKLGNMEILAFTGDLVRVKLGL